MNASLVIKLMRISKSREESRCMRNCNYIIQCRCRLRSYDVRLLIKPWRFIVLEWKISRRMNLENIPVIHCSSRKCINNARCELFGRQRSSCWNDNWLTEWRRCRKWIEIAPIRLQIGKKIRKGKWKRIWEISDCFNAREQWCTFNPCSAIFYDSEKTRTGYVIYR